jgi:hypothetical protein
MNQTGGVINQTGVLVIVILTLLCGVTAKAVHRSGLTPALCMYDQPEPSGQGLSGTSR